MNNKFKNVIAFGGFIIFAILIGVIIPNVQEEKIDIGKESIITINKESEVISNSNETKKKNIYIYVIGAVNNPGIVEVYEGARLYEVLEKVGGFTEDAEVNMLNLAKIVIDEEKVIVPYKLNEMTSDDLKAQEKINNIFNESVTSKGGLVNINTATKEELKTLNGIGDSTAEKIIEYRQNNKFLKIEDIKNVSRNR